MYLYCISVSKHSPWLHTLSAYIYRVVPQDAHVGICNDGEKGKDYAILGRPSGAHGPCLHVLPVLMITTAAYCVVGTTPKALVPRVPRSWLMLD